MNRAIALLPLCAATAGIAACGASGGTSGGSIASESASQIVQQMNSALESQHSVRLTGQVNSNGQNLTVDLTVVKPNAFDGTMTETNGGQFTVVTPDNTTYYITANGTFWSAYLANSGLVQLLAGKCITADSSEPGFSSLAQGVSDLGKVFSPNAGGELSSHVTKGAVTTVDGQQVVPLQASDGTVVDVAATGTPLPVRVTKAGAGGGQLDLSQWDATQTVATPSGCVSLQQLEGGLGASPTP